MGIDSYMTVVFWLGIVGMVHRAFCLLSLFFFCSSGDHPRVSSTKIGADVLGFFSGAFFLAWISYLKFYA